MTARVLRGAWGNAGEIGHIPVVPDGEPCPCGNRGCLERYLSLDAFSRRQDWREADWVDRDRPDLPQRHPHHREPVRPADDRARRPGAASLLERLAALGGRLPNSVSARARPRRCRASSSPSGGQHSVLRGAAALAVFGRPVAALRPDVREQRDRDTDGKGIAA